MLQRGQRIGPFVIDGYLTAGGSSEVYLARSVGAGGAGDVTLALKILREDQRHNAFRMTNEALALSQFHHPGVVTLLAHDTHDGRPWLALEFLPSSLFQRPPVSPADAVSLARSLSLTLADLHAAGIVHRDVKPHNVMLTTGGQPKLVDFGAAKLPVALATEQAPLLPLSTEPGSFLGTYEYAAPEQIGDAKRVDGRADVYALGVMVYEMLAGRRPFLATSRGRLISQHLNDRPPPLSSFAPSLPPSLVALVEGMLAKSPAARPDAAAVAAGLAAVSFSPRRERSVWIGAVMLGALSLYAPVMPRVPAKQAIDQTLDRSYRRFEAALFTGTVAEAQRQLDIAHDALTGPGAVEDPTLAPHHRYKEAALAKERGDTEAALALFASARDLWQPLVAGHPAQAYRALSICNDGMAEMLYHQGDSAGALALYGEAARSLPWTLPAARKNRQVPSYIDYQRALIHRDQGDSDAALASLHDAEAHERVQLTQQDSVPADAVQRSRDPWQLSRVLTLRAEILLSRHDPAAALALATEAVTRSRQALSTVAGDKRYRLAELLALDRQAEAQAALGRAPSPEADAERLAGLCQLAQGDPDNGQWAHALVDALVRRAQQHEGAQRRALAREALARLDQMDRRGQWRKDCHIRRWRELAQGLTAP